MYLCDLGRSRSCRNNYLRKIMKLSYKWLKNYLNLDISPEEVSEILTTIGLEVEGLETVESIKGGLEGVIVGHVITCKKHPDADKLSLTTIDIGEEDHLQIVCGAPNVAVGQKVLVATIGTTLYTKEGEAWKIKKGKIRGLESQGMICAADEVGLGDDHSGIVVLPESTEIGTQAAQHYNLENDVVFEIGLTPNRSDATSHLGVAKDLLAYLKVNKEYDDELKWPSSQHFVTQKTKLNIDVEVISKEACPRYAGITITDITLGESPDWLKNSLKSIGIKSINNIVDITNYVLHEMGQPLHAFDADKINGKKIIVTTLHEGTKFVSLDGAERSLKSDDLMICAGDLNPLCMAGIFGGLESGVTNETKNIFLESAYFDQKYIRRSSTKHNLRTEAAKVYEKGADPNIVVHALKRAASLIRKIAGGNISNQLIDIYPHEINMPEIVVRYQKINDTIGINFKKEEIQHILHSLDMDIKLLDENSILVKVGTNKNDVTREIDVIEEILRIYGLNNVLIPESVKSTISYTSRPDKNEIKEVLSNFISSKGYHEMMGLSLIESKYYKEILPVEEDKLVFINNTSNIHLDIMRPDMLLSGLVTVAYNLNRQQSRLNLFEVGKSYQKNENGYSEQEYITVFKVGRKQEESWLSTSKNEVDFFDIKNLMDSISKRLGLGNWIEEPSTDLQGLSYGIKWHKGGQPVFEYGEVSKSLLRKMGIKQPVFYGQINLALVLKGLTKSKTTVNEISKFPSIRRDLAIILDKAISFKQILQISKSVDKKILKDVNLFDVYEKEEHVGKGKKSYAVSFIFENSEKTLQDKEVDTILNKINDTLQEKLGAIIRK